MVETRPRNPYEIGSPIDDRKRFFGRESLFRVIEDNLYQGVKVILLHGQRRIGKSSVLRQIPDCVGNNEFVFISFDLEERSKSHCSHILHELAREIVDQLQIEPNIIRPPTVEEIDNDLSIFNQIFLSNIFQFINGKKIVFLLDEFDLIDNPHLTLTQQGLDFFKYLGMLIKQQENLFIIPVLGRFLDDMPNLLNLFKEAPCQEIGLLDHVSAKRLIAKPCEGILTYEQGAIEEILKLSAGHPYFTQVICFTLFSQAREDNNWRVTRTDVINIVGRIFHDDNAQAGLAWFWDGLPISEKVVFSAVAEAQNIANAHAKKIPEEALPLLIKHGVKLTENLNNAVKKLYEKGLLDDTQRRIKVEIVRCWLVQNHSVKSEIWQLEKIGKETIQQINDAAFSLYSDGKKQNALKYYQDILELNPNHFATILKLAKVHWEVGNFDQALELYERAYQFDPIRNKDKLLDALEEYGHRLLNQKDFARARQQYERVLKIEPHMLSARKRLAGIALFQGKVLPVNITLWLRQKQSIQVLLAVGIVAIAIPAVSLVYRSFNPCPVGKKEQLGIFCVADINRISRCDRTFFPEIQNPNRDRGIQAFKKGRYKDAAEFFKKAVADDRNDPEVLIYYNNALARLKGSPFTLAAVVPAEDDNKGAAKEMLRGMAQAQNQFNEQGGLGGRLLEIVIANDGNYPEKAKQVAAELVQDKSILGIIGHNSSSATSAALGEYKKARLPVISPTSTGILLDSDVFFRTAISDAAAGEKLAKYAVDKLKLEKVVIFANPDRDYSNSMREVFTKEFEKLGGEVVPKAFIDITSKTIEQEVERSLFRYQAQAAVLFPDMHNTNITVKIAKANYKLTDELEKQGRKPLQLLGGDSLYNNNTLKGADAVEGLIIAVSWFRKAAQAKDFAQKAIKQWGGHVSWRTATSFDATQAFIHSFSEDTSRATILENLINVNLPVTETSGYPLQFQKGERLNEPILVKVKGGKFIKVKDN
ncbi:MAG: ABC transporter substrate-binding protein [Calothrix sp. MO_192.B10]|nr:ABC transporter substrate-binding protein [Calothrix sp. MO_192.B10]